MTHETPNGTAILAAISNGGMIPERYVNLVQRVFDVAYNRGSGPLSTEEENNIRKLAEICGFDIYCPTCREIEPGHTHD